MKRWNFLLLLFLLIGSIVLLILFAPQLLRETIPQRPRIVFVYKTLVSGIEFWDNITEGINAAAEEFEVHCEIIGGKEEADIIGNIQALENAIAMNPDAIVLVAADYKLFEPYAQHIGSSKTLLLTMDSDVAGGWSRCFIATDNTELGRKMGGEMLNRIPQTGKVAVVGHIQGTNSAIERVSGVLEALSGLESGRVLETVYCDNRVIQAKEVALELIAKHPDIVGMIATNEISAVGVGMAVSSLNLQNEISIVTCDNSSQQISYLEQGVIDATVAQRPFNMGYMSVQLALELLKNPNAKDFPSFYDTGSEVITRENMYNIENQKLMFPFRG